MKKLIQLELHASKYRVSYSGKTLFWNGQTPIALGHPARVILNRKEQQFSVRDLMDAQLNQTVDDVQDIHHPLLSLTPLSLLPQVDLTRLNSNIQITLPEFRPQLEEVFFHQTLKRFFGSAVALLLLLFLFQPSEPETEDEELIPAKYAKLIMKPQKQSRVAKGGSNPSQASQKSISRAFQSKTVQKSLRSMLRGGLSKYSLMTSGKAISRLARETASAGSQPGVGLIERADGLLGGSRIGTQQIGSDTGYGSGTGVNVAGQGTGQSRIGLNMGNASVDEGLTKEEVAKVIHSHINEIRYCYESAILKNPTLAGKIQVDFKIAGTGQVSTAAASQSSVNDAAVEQCLLGKLKRWKFPQPRGSVMVAVSYPFVFKSLSR